MVVFSERPASMYSQLQVVLHSTARRALLLWPHRLLPPLFGRLLTQRCHCPPEELCLPQKRSGVDACQPDHLTV